MEPGPGACPSLFPGPWGLPEALALDQGPFGLALGLGLIEGRLGTPRN